MSTAPNFKLRHYRRRLLLDSLAELRACGHDRASLAVVAQNHAARAFYRAMGGVEVGRFIDPGPLWRSANIIIRWSLDQPEPGKGTA